MDNVIARVAKAANLSPEVARKAVALIADFIQREASEDAVKDLFEKAPELQAIVASGAPTGGEGMGFGLKGLMGIAAGAMGGGGLMSLAGELMGLGLSMDQIQTAGKEVFDLRARGRGRSDGRRNRRLHSGHLAVHLEEFCPWARTRRSFRPGAKPTGARPPKRP